MSLAVKYRPDTFDNVVGQEFVTSILKHQLYTNTLKRSYLFVGPSGCGKTTCARILAKNLSCTPVEIDAASNNGVDDVRKIIESANFKNIAGGNKVYIIDECHMLSISAWNALLKLLEEPPLHCTFILCTTDPQKIPATIISRVQRFNFRKISINEIIERLNEILIVEGRKLQDDIIFEIARSANGGMRSAITMLDKVLDYDGNISYSDACNILDITGQLELSKLVDAIYGCDVVTTIDIIENFDYLGKDFKILVRELFDFVFDENKECLLKGKRDNRLMEILNLLINIINEIKYDTNPKNIVLSELLLSYNNWE